MATMIASTAEQRTSQIGNRTGDKVSRRSRQSAGEENSLGTRFFLSKPGTNGNALELGQEFSSEGEARVEALKLGLTYYGVQEWRPVADFAGKNPELKREAVTRKGAG